MANNCTEDRCAHYIANDKFHVYRHKFLWTIILATVIASGCFAYITYSFKQAHASIATTHESSLNKLQELLEPAKYLCSALIIIVMPSRSSHISGKDSRKSY